MSKLNQMIKIAEIHADRIKIALNALLDIVPFDAYKVENLSQEELLLTDFLVHRFGKLQDLLGHKIIDEFLEYIGEYRANLSMLDKINKLERLEIIEDSTLWREMRNIRNHITHEYPEHPELTAFDLNKIVDLAPVLLRILENIKIRIGERND